MCVLREKKRQVFTGLGFLLLPSYPLLHIPSLKEELDHLFQKPRTLSRHLDSQLQMTDPTSALFASVSIPFPFGRILRCCVAISRR